MSYIGVVPSATTSESSKISRFNKVYTSPGGETTFVVTFNNNNIDVILNGIKLRIHEDFTPLNNKIILTEPTEEGDVVDLTGYYDYNFVIGTNYATQQFVTQAIYDFADNSNTFLTTDAAEFYYTTKTQHESDILQTKNEINNELLFYHRSDQKALFPAFYSNSQLDANVTINADENAMIIGPVSVNGTILVNGTLTVI